MEKVHAAYKRYFDASLRGSLLADIKSEDYAFVRKDYSNPEPEKRHEPSPVDQDPLTAGSITHNTIALDFNRQHERVSRDRVVLAPPTLMPTPSGSSAKVADATLLTMPPHRPIFVPLPHRGLSDLPTSYVPTRHGMITSAGIASVTHPVAQAKQWPSTASALTSPPKPRRPLS